MPNLRKIISNIKLRRDKDDDHVPEISRPYTRQNPRQFGVHKPYQGNTNVRPAGVRYDMFPIQEDWATEALKKDFTPSRPHAQSTPLRPHPPQSNVRTPVSPRRDISPPPRVPAPILVGRYGFTPHPDNIVNPLAATVEDEETLLERTSSLECPYEEAKVVVESWSAASSPTDEVVPSIDESAPARPPMVGCSRSSSKQKLPAIREMDWSQLTQEDAQNIFRAYGNLSPHSSAMSPADSAVEFPGDAPQLHNGKGKARQLDSESSSLSSADLRPFGVRFPDALNAEWRRSGEDDADDDLTLKLKQEWQKQRRREEERLVEEEEESLAAAIEFERQDRNREEARRRLEELDRLQALELERHDREADEREERKAAEDLARAIAEEEENQRKAVELATQLRQEQEEEDRKKAQELQEELEREWEQEQAAERAARRRDCTVCGDTKETSEFHDKAPTSACEHPANTCKECLESWMASEFETKGCDGIKCPECPKTLEYNDFQVAASKETFDAYDNLTMRNALGSNDEFSWCLKAGCGAGQLNHANNNFMDCVSCGYKQCLQHKCEWHTNETCEQYEYRTTGQKQRDEERKTEAMLDEISKKCPNKTCGWRIQKIDGCEHMTCKKCKHEFCWQCLAAHSEIKRVGNTAHAINCKFHSDNLEVTWPFNMH